MPPERQRILQRTGSVAMVGASPNPARSSYFVLTYLPARSSDSGLYLVNPTLPEGTEILGLPVYPSLDALPEVPDLVDAFRRVDDLPTVADEAIAAGANTLWFQLGLRHDGAAQKAHDAGLTVVARTAASRSSTPASTAGCTWPASTPASSAPAATDPVGCPRSAAHASPRRSSS